MSYQNPPWQHLIAKQASSLVGNFLQQFGQNYVQRMKRKRESLSQQQKESDQKLEAYNKDVVKNTDILRQNFYKAGLKNDSFFNLMKSLIDTKGALELQLPNMSHEEQIVGNARLDLIKERLLKGVDDIKFIDNQIKGIVAQEIGSDVDGIPGLNTPGGLTSVGNQEWWDRVNALAGKAFDKNGKVLPLVTYGYKKGGSDIWATRCLEANADGECVGKTDTFNVKQLLSDQMQPGTILTIGSDQNQLWDSMSITDKNGKVTDRYLSQKVFGSTSDDGKTTFDVQPTNYSKIVNDYGTELAKQVSILLDSEDGKDINAAWFYYGGERASKYGALPTLPNGKIDMTSDGALLFQDMYIEMGLSNNVPLYQLENVQEVIPSTVDEDALREAGVSEEEITRKKKLQTDISWEDEGNIKQDREKYQAPIQSERRTNIKPVKSGVSKSKDKSINQLTSLIKNAGAKIRKDRLGGNAILKMIQENPRQYGLTGTQLEKILTTAKVANPKNKSKNNPYGLNTSGNPIEDIKRILELIPSIKKVLSPQEVSDLVDQEFKQIIPSQEQVDEVLEDLRTMIQNRK